MSWLFVVLFIVIVGVSGVRIGCPAGSWIKGTKCRLCPRGTYSSYENSTSCTKCREGTYQPFYGAQGSDVCRVCPDNTRGTQQGAATKKACKPCPLGTRNNGLNFTCLSCAPGTVPKRSISCLDCEETCETCQKGYYQRTNKCAICPVGMTTLRIKSASINDCVPCPSGSAIDREGRCYACNLGSSYSYYENSSKTCKTCPVGTTTSKCVPCPRGQYSRFGECNLCPKGYMANGPGAGFCKRVGGPCPSTAFTKKNGDCLSCQPRERFNREAGSCDVCPPGSVSSGGLTEVCTPCPEGRFPSLNGETCICKAGMEPDGAGCRNCLPGFFKTYSGVWDKDCLPCPRGMYSVGGAEKCSLCPRGRETLYEATTGVDGCKACQNGTVPSSESWKLPESILDRIPLKAQTVCVVPQTSCPIGYSRKKIYPWSPKLSCIANSCPKGSFRAWYGTCIKCLPGEEPRNGECKKCPENKVSVGGDATCTKCLNNFVRSFTDGSKCVCENQRYLRRELVKKRCEFCKAGTYRAEITHKKCVKCPPGTSSGDGYAWCVPCPTDTFSLEGSSKCTPCPPGTFSYGSEGTCHTFGSK